MEFTFSSQARRTTAKVLAQYKVAEETESRLVLQTKRIVALLAAAFVGLFGAVTTGVAFGAFYPPLDSSDLGTLWLGGGLGIAMLLLALMFLYGGLRRPDRIVADAHRREVLFERRKDPRRVSFDEIDEIAVRTEDRSRRRERCIVHPVVVVTKDGTEIQVDAASDIEEMIRLAAKLRRVTGVSLVASLAGSNE